MFKNVKQLTAGITFVVILTTISLAGCSSDVSQNKPSSLGQQSSTSSDQGAINQPTQQQPSSSNQQPSDSLGQQPPDTSNMTAILNRAAEMGISSDDFIAAFNSAMTAGGPPNSGQHGQQPPAFPSEQQGEPPAPPSGQQMSQSQLMTEVYEKMAIELNISADDIAEAIAQAEKISKNDIVI